MRRLHRKCSAFFVRPTTPRPDGTSRGIFYSVTEAALLNGIHKFSDADDLGKLIEIVIERLVHLERFLNIVV
ncbi:MAG: hypothetical protein IKQ91_01430, partial [Oscillospiraceae bacterium]|nr:hypothetical protein [Oscillospiraceae bacterium]